MPKLQPATREAIDLLHKGAIAFARMESYGLRIDTDYLQKAIKSTKQRINNLDEEMRDMNEAKVWAKHYGLKTNLQSKSQLANVVFKILGNRRNPYLRSLTDTGRDKNDMAAFEHLRSPFMMKYKERGQLKKASDYLVGIQRETVNGFVHPFFDLHTAESYRPSSSKPNYNNQPIRVRNIAETVRSCVIPREDHLLLEVDYSTQEVRIAYCYNEDPKLRSDMLEGDMHRDRTLDIYLLSLAELGPTNKNPGKITRYVGKNKFVFAEFYGSYFKQRAPELWDAISLYDLQRSDGVSLYDHLAAKGLKKLGPCDPDQDPLPGTFEKHIQEVEKRMWEVYSVYAQWKEDWWALYHRQGGVHSKTGFTMYGDFRRNQVVCDPIQGSAFHCLLWSFIELQNEIIRKKMRSKTICQIYDSMLIDCHKSELWDVVEMVKRIATKEILEYWKWIICPLDIELELAEKNWFLKEPLKESA